MHQGSWQLIPVRDKHVGITRDPAWTQDNQPPKGRKGNQSSPRGTTQQREPTFLAESSKEFFTAEPSHLSIFTGLSSIFHCNGNVWSEGNFIPRLSTRTGGKPGSSCLFGKAWLGRGNTHSWAGSAYTARPRLAVALTAVSFCFCLCCSRCFPRK